VSFELFHRQVKLACQAGASGFLAGRALWQEATQISSRQERLAFLETTVAKRLESLTELANAYGTPWHTKIEAIKVDESWHQNY
jgi:tagatose 1,6-diphosphate aldolase